MSNDPTVLRNPTALLVLRAWIEHGSSLPLRAYIRETSDVSLGFEHSSTETDVEAAVATVRAFLEGLLPEESADESVEAPAAS